MEIPAKQTGRSSRGRVPDAPKQIDPTHEYPKMKQTRRHHRAGQSLVEFAIVSLVLYMLLAAILTFGHMLYVAQGLQGAADLAAREISRTPLPAVKPDGAYFDFNDALSADDVRQRIYDEAFLVIDLDDFYENFPPPPNRLTSIFQDLAPTLPLLNQQLLPLMIVDPSGDEGTRRLLRYPGALLNRGGDAIAPPRTATASAEGPYDTSVSYKSWIATEFRVRIPLVSRSSEGIETIQLVDVIEEIKGGSATSPFRIDSPQQGIVALRMNYPFQSASMSSFEPNPQGVFADEPHMVPNAATDDGSLTRTNSLGEEVYVGPYGGTNGLGAQGAFGKKVRPYRRVISAQAIYRREIFE